MRDKLTTVIITFVILGIIGVLIVFGMIAFEEITKMSNVETATDPVQWEENENQVANQDKTLENNIEVPRIVENPLDKLTQTPDTNTNVDYSNVNVNKYFYNQLEEYSKTIYKAFESNKEEMKSGTKQIELGDSFSSLLSQANGQELLGKYYQSAIEAYTYDNPEVFYLSPNKMFLNIETTTRGNAVSYRVYINSGNEANYLTDEFTSKEQVESAIAQIEQVKNQILQNATGDTYQDIKMVHDYLVDTISYDSSLSKPYIYNIYGALVEKLCVCEGYARSMKYLLDSLDIPCTIVIGKGTNSEGKTENHAWNYVEIEGKWYAIDATWDDPVIIGNGTLSQSSKYRYFLKGSNEMAKDHTPSNTFTDGGKEFTYPSLSLENYE